VVTSDKEGPIRIDRELVDADVVISQTVLACLPHGRADGHGAEAQARADRGDRLGPCGSGRGDPPWHHVAEVTYSNSISVSEHVVMMILGLVRNYIRPTNGVKGGWNIADCVERSYDLEGMVVGTVAAGRIGLAVLKRLKPFDVELHSRPAPGAGRVEQELGLTFHPDAASMVPACGCHHQCAAAPETDTSSRRMFGRMKRGTYLVKHGPGQDLPP